MAKNNKKKRNRKNHSAKSKRYQVMNFGPIQIEQVGRFVRFSNNSTPEQQKAFIRRLEQMHPKIVKDLEVEVLKLQSFVRQYNPIELMHRAAHMVLPLFMNYRSENEFASNESQFLPALEYLQYLIARTEPATDSIQLSENEWQQIWGQVLRVLQLTQNYLWTR